MASRLYCNSFMLGLRMTIAVFTITQVVALAGAIYLCDIGSRGSGKSKSVGREIARAVKRRTE